MFLCYVQNKPQATSHKPQGFKLGFTLSELLVSLGVLGLIAGLTVPSIVVSVEKAKTKALQKESVQILSEIINTGVLNGDFSSISNWDLLNSSSPIVQYFTQKLNARQCPRGITSFPCNHNWANMNSYRDDHSGRWVLTNGVKIWLIGSDYVNSTNITFLIDSKPQGLSTYWKVGADQLLIICNISDTTQTFAIPQKSGQCGPFPSGPIEQWNALWQ